MLKIGKNTVMLCLLQIAVYFVLVIAVLIMLFIFKILVAKKLNNIYLKSKNKSENS